MARYYALLLSVYLLLSQQAMAAPKSKLSFYQYIKQLKIDLINEGANTEQVNKAFSKVKFIKRAVNMQQVKQHSLSIERHLSLIVNARKISLAKAFYRKNSALLQKIARKYHIQPRFIVALWGIENNFSQTAAGYDALSILSSLAFIQQSNDSAQQLKSAIKVSVLPVMGEMVLHSNMQGNLGLLNVSPYNYLSSYQDFNDDGLADVWHSKADSFATAAHYLSVQGWDNKFTWGRQVSMPKHFDHSKVASGYQSLSYWSKLGLTRVNKRPLPTAQLTAKLVLPDGINGPAYLTYPNFEHLLSWNHSLYRTLAVVHLANNIR
ncbi:MAG: lytic murein transglycosylase [Psychrobium sp.]|nr:lytic murein transglycosylase [Psychrobium sp.]